jgi:PIN domain nuclease of toxin-antitoxin system
MNGPFILDTCACLWLLSDDLPAQSVETLAKVLNLGLPTYVSPITALEVGTLARKRRFKSSLSPQRWFKTLMDLTGMALAAMPAELLMDSALLPGGIQSDPYDRIIAATAREYGYTVMTRDRALLDYAAQGYLSAVEC